MKSVYLTVNGIGLGHAGRSLKIGERLAREGYKITFSSYGEAVAYISSRFPCIRVPEMRLGWRSFGGLSLRETSKFLLKRALFNFLKQIIIELRTIRKINPQLVYSDSRGSSLIAAKILRKNSILLTNQLSSFLPEQKTGKIFISLSNKLSPIIMPRIWNLAKVICVNDLPPPYSISKRNLRARIKRKKVKFIGLIGNLESREENTFRSISNHFRRKRSIIYVSATGPKEERERFASKMLDIIPKIREYNFVMTLGDLRRKDFSYKGENFIVYGWFSNRDVLISAADVIISRAGRATIDECILRCKPMIIIPSIRQTEQEENARRVKELGLGEMIYEGNLNVRNVRGMLEKIFSDYNSYLKREERLRRVSDELGGIDTIVELIREFTQ